MDTSHNKQPRQITDSVDIACRHCSQVIYSERLIAELQADATYTHRREVRGNFHQLTDADGLPRGPVIPFCHHCTQEKHHAQG